MAGQINLWRVIAWRGTRWVAENEVWARSRAQAKERFAEEEGSFRMKPTRYTASIVREAERSYARPLNSKGE